LFSTTLPPGPLRTAASAPLPASPAMPVMSRNTSHVSDYSISTSASGGSGGYATPVPGTAAAADKKKRAGEFSRLHAGWLDR